MKYRTLGPKGPEVSVLGYGCMRMPVIDGVQNRIDYPLATTLLRDAIDAGLNYIDTAFP
jgi:predicted aldo/keto reductase-like oxidoreductase